MTEVKLNPGKTYILKCGVFARRDILQQDRAGYLCSLRNEAGCNLGVKLLETAAIHEFRSNDGTGGEDFMFPWQMGEEHTWTVGVIAPDDTRSFVKQLAEARRKGMMAAADLAVQEANRYIGLEGVCGPVIRSSLHRLADHIRDEAKKETHHETDT